MNKLLMTTAMCLVLTGNVCLPAFANSNAGSTLWIAATVEGGSVPAVANSDLSLTEYEALLWTQIKGVGSHGEAGTSVNILTYDTWDHSVIQKSKGLSDAGSPEIELARSATDPGQVALREAANSNDNFALKIVRNDAPVNGTPTILYNRGLVTKPKRPMGRNEDFDLEVFTCGFNQLELVDDAE